MFPVWHYTGAFVFGRTKQRHLPNGKVCSRVVPREEWILIPDVHPGYITWEEYQSNQQHVKSNALAWSTNRCMIYRLVRDPNLVVIYFTRCSMSSSLSVSALTPMKMWP
jgi:hypothetical protein